MPAAALLHLPAGDEIRVAQAHLAPGREAEEPARRILHEVVALDEEFAGERHAAHAGGGVLGIVDRLELLRLTLRVVLDHHPERPQHRHAALRRTVQDLAHAVLEQGDIDQIVALRDADAPRELANRGRRHAAPAQPGERRHARIVPPAHVALLDQLDQAALGQDGVRQIEPRELVLARPARHRQMLDQPVVQRPVVFELERAQRVRHPLDRIRLAVREVVGRVDAPRIAGARVRGVQDAIEHRIAQIEVARCHVDLRAQDAGAVRELAGAHAAQQVEVLLGRAIAVRAVPAGLGERAAVSADLRRATDRRRRRRRDAPDARPTRTAARNSPRRNGGARPSRSRASARRAGSPRCNAALP